MKNVALSAVLFFAISTPVFAVQGKINTSGNTQAGVEEFNQLRKLARSLIPSTYPGLELVEDPVKRLLLKDCIATGMAARRSGNLLAICDTYVSSWW